MSDVPPWSHYAQLNKPERSTIAVSDLVHLREWRAPERRTRCNGIDPMSCLVAYAQDELTYENGRLVKAASRAAYDALPRDEKLNRFGPIYRDDAPFLCHRKLADVMVEAAIDLYLTQRWHMVVFDSLRTMEAGWQMYRDMHPDDRTSGLLAPPGSSAHNRALAADCMFFDVHGVEIEMGGHFDHGDMAANHRNYEGPRISETAQKNRMLREAGFQRGALRCGTLIAPLREEFWDDRMPGSPADLWRVLESVARCTGLLPHPAVEALKLKNKGLSSPAQAEEAYANFAEAWRELFTPHTTRLRQMLGADATSPPPLVNFTFHEWLNLLYDRDLKAHNLHLSRHDVE